jgi:hypothetical protein
MKTRATPGISRREFLKNNAALAALTATGPAAGLASLHASELEQPELRKLTGIQVGSVSFVDEGVGQVLGLLQERAAIDTLFLTTFTYGRGLAGRQIPGHPFPDHGAQESDEKSFHKGDYATPHAEFYRHDTYAATLAALKAGAHGVILSRKYSEMRLANLSAAGRAVRETRKG